MRKPTTPTAWTNAYAAAETRNAREPLRRAVLETLEGRRLLTSVIGSAGGVDPIFVDTLQTCTESPYDPDIHCDGPFDDWDQTRTAEVLNDDARFWQGYVSYMWGGQLDSGYGTHDYDVNFTLQDVSGTVVFTAVEGVDTSGKITFAGTLDGNMLTATQTLDPADTYRDSDPNQRYADGVFEAGVSAYTIFHQKDTCAAPGEVNLSSGAAGGSSVDLDLPGSFDVDRTLYSGADGSLQAWSMDEEHGPSVESSAPRVVLLDTPSGWDAAHRVYAIINATEGGSRVEYAVERVVVHDSNIQLSAGLAAQVDTFETTDPEQFNSVREANGKLEITMADGRTWISSLSGGWMEQQLDASGNETYRTDSPHATSGRPTLQADRARRRNPDGRHDVRLPGLAPRRLEREHRPAAGAGHDAAGGRGGPERLGHGLDADRAVRRLRAHDLVARRGGPPHVHGVRRPQRCPRARGRGRRPRVNRLATGGGAERLDRCGRDGNLGHRIHLRG